MKASKKLICIISALVILVLAVVPSFAIDLSELTYLYIDKGNITIGDNSVSGYGYYGQHITNVNPKGYCITFSKSSITNTTNTVVIDGGDNHVALKNLSIDVHSLDFACAFTVKNSAKVDLFFTGNNTLVSHNARAGLEISSDGEVTISGDGTLECRSNGQAGIGGGGGSSNGTVIINSGTIIAQCVSDNSAGIGGGSSGNGGNIIINGGNITANAGKNGAGIGGGSSGNGGNITINGGTVTATGGENGAGIGGGWYGQMGTVTINGGSVKAVAGYGAPAIGAGKGIQSTGGAVNSDGISVYPFTVSSDTFEINDKIFINGTECVVCGNHPNDSNFYFYAPSGDCFVATDSNEIYKTTVSDSGSSSFELIANPVQAINGASIGSDNIIRGISCGLTDLNDYLSVDDGYSLVYDNDFIGTGTGVIVMYGNTPVFRYCALLYGDVNNDGFYDAEDSVIVMCILCNMLTRSNTDSIIFEAADADRSGYISEDDVHLLEKAGLLLSTVSRTDGSFSLNSEEFEEYIILVDQTPYQNASAESAESEIEIKPETKLSFIDFIRNFIENVIKAFSYILSFGKNYFINILH